MLSYTILAVSLSMTCALLTSWTKDTGCYLLLGQKLRHKDIIVDKKVSVLTLYDCKKQCDNAFNCRSFSYNTDFDDRYKNNCLLSRRDVNELQLRDGPHLQLDKDYIFYGKVSHQQCYPQSTNLIPASRTVPGGASSCFRLAKKGVRMSNKYVRSTSRVNSPDECERKCLQAGFTCRGFNFRRQTGLSAHYMDNCELTYQDTYGTDLDNKLYFYGHYDYDFYERIGFSSLCGTPSLSGVSQGRENPWHVSSSYPRYSPTTECFRLFRKNSRPDVRLILQKHHVTSLQQCQQLCQQLLKCRSFAYRYSAGGSSWYGDNCYLSDYRVSNFHTTFDLVNDAEFDLYEKDDRTAKCRNMVQGRSDSYANGGGHLTVSGQKCYQEKCLIDPNGHYYFCETDDAGAWDYCCRPDDVCHRSQGYPTSWCYVGIKGKDQWRPCAMSTYQGSRAFLKSEPPKNLSMMAQAPKSQNKIPHAIELKNIEDLPLKT